MLKESNNKSTFEITVNKQIYTVIHGLNDFTEYLFVSDSITDLLVGTITVDHENQQIDIVHQIREDDFFESNALYNQDRNAEDLARLGIYHNNPINQLPI